MAYAVENTGVYYRKKLVKCLFFGGMGRILVNVRRILGRTTDEKKAAPPPSALEKHTHTHFWRRGLPVISRLVFEKRGEVYIFDKRVPLKGR